jgi:hypothetical protein
MDWAEMAQISAVIEPYAHGEPWGTIRSGNLWTI